MLNHRSRLNARSDAGPKPIDIDMHHLRLWDRGSLYEIGCGHRYRRHYFYSVQRREITTTLRFTTIYSVFASANSPQALLRRCQYCSSWIWMETHPMDVGRADIVPWRMASGAIGGDNACGRRVCMRPRLRQRGNEERGMMMIAVTKARQNASVSFIPLHELPDVLSGQSSPGTLQAGQALSNSC
jgi:hypothetical protein